MSTLEAADREAAAVAVAPRVTLDDIKAAIVSRNTITADRAMADAICQGATQCDELKTLTICILVMKNGFTVIGKSAPAAPENFDRELGAKFAYEDAIRQLWPLMGYALRERLAGA